MDRVCYLNLLKVCYHILGNLRYTQYTKKFCDACGVLEESLKPRNGQYYIIFPWEMVLRRGLLGG
jgi:hypothetical protein